jgi:hypothetical protein
MMDGSRFDQFSRALTGSRRSVLGGTLALVAGWLGASRIEAKKKHKKRKPKVKPNEFGCLEVGDPCKNATQCCSGVCDGKKGKKRCGAHGAGTCDQNGAGVCTADNLGSFRCNNEVNCACIHTTAGSNFCADLDVAVLEICADCQTDADCEALGRPAGSACIPVFAGECAGLCDSGMACFAPCGYVPPES